MGFPLSFTERFENTLDWYMDSYLPAFDALILAIKKVKFPYNLQNIIFESLYLE